MNIEADVFRCIEKLYIAPIYVVGTRKLHMACGRSLRESRPQLDLYNVVWSIVFPLALFGPLAVCMSLEVSRKNIAADVW